ncbi:hypothetical protein LG296_20815 (plasmid) [Ureibacillus chungkukjangi]|uniref:hypothetical protein n=1 Tax=Ureibacillus chungkukjangi TaxID=1202712 RepID=UPI000D342465|nr:hypothetical protein [Ureibacillus chungkukjangi]MCM3389997.1 hypothetical protein [Ureibacillus chungkukjangi]
MKMSKVFKTIVPAAAGIIGLTYAARKGRNPMKSSSGIVQAVSEATATIKEEKTFAGLPLSQLEEIALNTARGICAEIFGDTCAFTFKSASGKQSITANFRVNSEGKWEIICPYPDAKAPLFFLENIKKAMKENSEAR